MKLKELLQWFLKLLPKQKMQDVGEGSIQAGRVGGDLTHQQSTDNSQHIYNSTIVLMPSQSTISTVVEPSVDANEEQAIAHRLAVLKMMRLDESLKARGRAFMKREFGDALVKALNNKQAFRTRRYLEACINNDKLKQQQEAL